MHILQARSCFIHCAGALALLFSMPAWPAAATSTPTAAPDTPLSIADALKWASVDGMQISPDGKHIAGIIQLREVNGVILYDTATLVPRLLKSDTPTLRGALSLRWFNDRFLAIQSLNGSDLIESGSMKYIDAGNRFIRKVNPDSEGNERFVYFRDPSVFRYNFGTKTKEWINRSPPERPVVQWIYDHEGEARAVTTINTAFFSDDTQVTHWYRESPKHSWEKLATFAYLDDIWMPEAFNKDDQALIVSSRQDRDTSAYFRYDLKQRKVGEMLAGHPTQDIYADFESGEIDAKYVLTRGIKPEIKWLDAKGDALQRSVDLALPDRINLLQGNPETQLLIYSYSDRDPGRWFVLDAASGALRLVTSRKPEIDVDKMRPKQIIEYKARDGLPIPAYLTTPARAGAVPAVIYIHGGPAVRDEWDWDPQVQMLASRGYTVFQPQFRGSGGFGKHYTAAGFGQWGLAMQDDITDGVRWLVEHGHADPARICIYGASYGGYAALWGLAKTPSLYRCGASFAGVSDLQYMLKDDSDVNAHATGRLYLSRIFGTSAARKQVLDHVSPLKNAALFRAPVLIAHGEWDNRVPIRHSEKMVKALENSDKEVEWLELKEEGHGLFHEKNQERFFQALFNLFGRTIGQRAPAPAPAQAK